MRKHILLAALLLASVTVTAGSATAAGLPQSKMSGMVAGSGELEPVQWGGRSRCGYWRRECARRFGWGTWRARRCMWRHGCFFGGRDRDDDRRGRDRDDDDGDRGDRGRRGGRDRDRD